MGEILDTVVIGGGQAGLAAGYHLRRAGLRFRILERADEVGGSWAQYYDSLTLFSPARYAALPGLPFGGDPDRYPLRDEVVTYLRSYAARFQLPVCTGVDVVDVTRVGGTFTVMAADGRRFQARTLIAATGSFHQPCVPVIPGHEVFGGEVLHASGYRNVEPFRGKRVVVVGAGNSAVQIAVELAREAEVTLATRTPVRFAPQRVLGRDIHFWVRVTGLDFLSLLDSNAVAVLDSGVYQQALAAGQPERRPMFTRYTEGGVQWADGTEEPIDAVIYATGYRPHLAYLRTLGALADDGTVLQRRGVSLSVPGLYFVGLSGQRNFASATLRGVGPDAAVVVRALRRHLRAHRMRMSWLGDGWRTWARCCGVGKAG